MKQSPGIRSLRVVMATSKPPSVVAVLTSPLGMHPDAVPPLEGFSAEQHSMIASAVAGGLALCCTAGREARETIAETAEQLAKLARFAEISTGCQLEKRKPVERVAFVERYLRRTLVAVG